MAAKYLVKVKEHKVKKGDTIDSIAKENDMTWQELAKFNWGTDIPNKINVFLRDIVGCHVLTNDLKYLRFWGDEKNLGFGTGFLWIPEDLSLTFASNKEHHIDVKTINLLNIEEPECIVEFRPHADWKGEKYGFDWNRIGDTDVGTAIKDYKFKDFVGKHPDNDYNVTCVPDSTLYISLKDSEYAPNSISIPDGLKIANDREECYVPWLSFYPVPSAKKLSNGEAHPLAGKIPEAELKLHIEITVPPKNLQIEFDSKFFEISGDGGTVESPPKGSKDESLGKKYYVISKKGATGLGTPRKENITIKCVKKNNKIVEIDTEKLIKVMTLHKISIEDKNNTGTLIISKPNKFEDKKLVGMLKVMPNIKKDRRIKKFLFVNVITDLSVRGTNPQPGLKDVSLEDKELTLSKFCHHALIDPVVEYVTLDITSDLAVRTAFNNAYIDSASGELLAFYKKDKSLTPPTNTHEPTGFTVLHKFLNNELRNQEGSTYDTDYIKMFFLADPINRVNVDGSLTGLNGLSYGSTIVLLVPGIPDSTPAHEAFHSLGLAHTWESKPKYANAEYTYEYKKTENIMDYTHHRPSNGSEGSKQRWYTYHWQWEKMQDKADTEP